MSNNRRGKILASHGKNVRLEEYFDLPVTLKRNVDNDDVDKKSFWKMGKGILDLWQKAKEKVKAAIFPYAEINDGKRYERNEDGVRGKMEERFGQRKEDVDIYRNVQGYKRPFDWDFGIVEKKRKVRCHNSSAQTDFEYKHDQIPFKTPLNAKNCHDQKNKNKNVADEEIDTKASEDLEGDEQIQRVLRKVIRKVQRKKLDLSKEGEIAISAIEKNQEIIECENSAKNFVDRTEKTPHTVESKNSEPKEVFEEAKALTETQPKAHESINETHKTYIFPLTQEIILIEDSELPSKTSEFPDSIPSTEPSLLKTPTSIQLLNTLSSNPPPSTNPFVLSSHPIPTTNTSLSPSTQTTQISPFLNNPPQQSLNPPDNIYNNPPNQSPLITTPIAESNPFLNLNSVQCMQVPYKFGQNFPPSSNSPCTDNKPLPLSPYVFNSEHQQNLFSNQMSPFNQQDTSRLSANIFSVPPQNVGNSYHQVPGNYNIKSPSPAIKDIEMGMVESSKKGNFEDTEYRNQSFSSNASSEFARNTDSCTKNTNEQVKKKSLFNGEVKSLFLSPKKGENLNRSTFGSLAMCQSSCIKTPCLENIPMYTSDSPSELFSSQHSAYKTPQSQGLFDNKPNSGSNILFKSPSEDGLMSFSAQKCKDNTNTYTQNNVFGNNCFGNTEKNFATPSTVTSTPGNCEGGFSLGIVIPKNRKNQTHK